MVTARPAKARARTEWLTIDGTSTLRGRQAPIGKAATEALERLPTGPIHGRAGAVGWPR